MNMNLRFTFALASLVVLCGCPPTPQPPPGPDASDASVADATPPTPDPVPDDAAAATCTSWCTHASALGCAAAKPTAKGAPCVEVCNNVQSGVAPFKLKCRITAKTCVAADACEK